MDPYFLSSQAGPPQVTLQLAIVLLDWPAVLSRLIAHASFLVHVWRQGTEEFCSWCLQSALLQRCATIPLHMFQAMGRTLIRRCSAFRTQREAGRQAVQLLRKPGTPCDLEASLGPSSEAQAKNEALQSIEILMATGRKPRPKRNASAKPPASSAPHGNGKSLPSAAKQRPREDPSQAIQREQVSSQPAEATTQHAALEGQQQPLPSPTQQGEAVQGQQPGAAAATTSHADAHDRIPRQIQDCRNWCELRSLVRTCEAELTAEHVPLLWARLSTVLCYRVTQREEQNLQPLLQRLEHVTLLRLQQVTPEDCSRVLWAMGRLPCKVAPPLVQRLLGHLEARLGQLDSKNLSLLVWALGRMAILPSDSFWAAALAASADAMHRFNAQDIANTLVGMVKLKLRPSSDWLQLCASRAVQQLASANGQSMSNTLLSLAQLGYHPSYDWFETVMRETERTLLLCNGQSLAAVLGAVAKFGQSPSVAWMRAFQDQLQRHVSRLNAQDVGSIMWALAVMHTRITSSGNGSSSSGSGYAPLHTQSAIHQGSERQLHNDEGYASVPAIASSDTRVQPNSSIARAGDEHPAGQPGSASDMAQSAEQPPEAFSNLEYNGGSGDGCQEPDNWPPAWLQPTTSSSISRNSASVAMPTGRAATRHIAAAAAVLPDQGTAVSSGLPAELAGTGASLDAPGSRAPSVLDYHGPASNGRMPGAANDNHSLHSNGNGSSAMRQQALLVLSRGARTELPADGEQAHHGDDCQPSIHYGAVTEGKGPVAGDTTAAAATMPVPSKEISHLRSPSDTDSASPPDTAALLQQCGESVMERMLELLPSLPPQSLSQSVWGAARLGLNPQQRMLRLLLHALHRQLPHCNGEDFVQIAWALVLWRLRPPAAWMRSFMAYSRRQLAGMPPHSVSGIVMALAQLRYQPQWQWVLELFGATAGRLASFSPENLCQLAGALAQLRQRPIKPWAAALLAVIEDRVQQFQPREAAMVLWALAKLQVQPSGRCQDLCLSQLGLSGDGQFRQRQVDGHQDTAYEFAEEEESAFGQPSPALSHSLDAQHVSLVLWALARMPHRPSAATIQQLTSLLTNLIEVSDYHSIALSLVSLAQLRHAPGPAMIQSAVRRLERLPPGTSRSLVFTISALGHFGHRPPRSWLHRFFRVTQRRLPSLHAGNLASICSALARLRVRPPAAWLAELMECTTPYLKDFSATELTYVAVAVAFFKPANSGPWVAAWQAAAMRRLPAFKAHELLQSVRAITALHGGISRPLAAQIVAELQGRPGQSASDAAYIQTLSAIEVIDAEVASNPVDATSEQADDVRAIAKQQQQLEQ